MRNRGVVPTMEEKAGRDLFLDIKTRMRMIFSISTYFSSFHISSLPSPFLRQVGANSPS